MKEYVGNAAAAAYLGLPVNHWRSYVSRKLAPEPTRRDSDSKPGHGLPVWTKAQLDDWLTNRPGRGAPGRPRAKRRAA